MKVAVLVSGDFRSFPICRSTVEFLDSPDVDVYFSVWSKTRISNPKLNLLFEGDVNEQQIKNIMYPTRVKDLIIEQPIEERFERLRYSSRMFYRILKGIELIKQSGVKYDYLLVMRPDLYFSGRDKFRGFDNLIEYLGDGNTVAFSWTAELSIGKIGDQLFISTPENIYNLINSSIIREWNSSSKYSDIHEWLYHYTRAKNMKVSSVPVYLDSFDICRFNENINTFEDVNELSSKWDKDKPDTI